MWNRTDCVEHLLLVGAFAAGCAAPESTGSDSAGRLHVGETSADAGAASNPGPNVSRFDASPSVGGAATLYDYTCAGVEEFSTEPQAPPTMCEWAAALDVIAVGEIVSLESNRERYSVSYVAAARLETLIRENDLENEFPWLDEILAVPAEGRTSAGLVDSCPEGLREETPGGVLSVTVRPVVAVKLRAVQSLHGSTEGDLDFLAPLGGGVFVDDNGEVLRDGVMEDGAILGVGLTSAPGTTDVLVQGRQVPFTVSDGRVVAKQPCTPTPPFPDGLDGLTLAELQRELEGCDGTNEASQWAREYRATVRQSCFSGAPGVYCHAAQCDLHYSGEPPE